METTLAFGVAGSVILLLIGSLGWMVRRWIEVKDKRLELDAEKISLMKERLVYLESFKSSTEDRLRDGACSFKDARERIEHMEQTKISRMEFQAFVAKQEDEAKALKAFLARVDARLEETQDRLNTSIARFESKLDSLQELMSKIVILGNTRP